MALSARTLGHTSAIAALAWSVLATHSALAHHAFSANYDQDNVGTVQGVVEEVFWANPHVHYYIRVETEDGSRELWDVETSNLNSMARRGWTKNTLAVGDEIRVRGPLGHEGRRRIAMDEIERINGDPLPE